MRKTLVLVTSNSLCLCVWQPDRFLKYSVSDDRARQSEITHASVMKVSDAWLKNTK